MEPPAIYEKVQKPWPPQSVSKSVTPAPMNETLVVSPRTTVIILEASPGLVRDKLTIAQPRSDKGLLIEIAVDISHGDVMSLAKMMAASL